MFHIHLLLQKYLTMNRVRSNVVINIILIIIYVYFFGQHSVKRFLDKSVIITEHEEKQQLIDPPGMVLNYFSLIK